MPSPTATHEENKGKPVMKAAETTLAETYKETYRSLVSRGYCNVVEEVEAVAPAVGHNSPTAC